MAGVFPYMESGELRDRSGEVLIAELPLTAYEGGEFVSLSGESYTGTAYAPASTRDGDQVIDVVALVIGKSNRRLLINGEQHTIVGAIHHQFVGQLELQLKRNLAA